MSPHTDTWNVITPFGPVVVDFPEQGPAIFEGSGLAVDHLMQVMGERTNRMGQTMTAANLEPHDLLFFCQDEGVKVLPPADFIQQEPEEPMNLATLDNVGDESLQALRAKLKTTVGVRERLAIMAQMVQIHAGTSEVVTLTGNELGVFPNTYEGRGELRKAAEMAWAELHGKPIYCPALDAKVELRKNNQTPAKFFFKNFNPKKLKTVAAIEGLIEAGKKFKPSTKPYNAQDTSVRLYHYLRAEFELDGEKLAARLVIKEDQDGHFHYDHTVHYASDILDGVQKETWPAEASHETHPLKKPASVRSTITSRLDAHLIPAEDAGILGANEPFGQHAFDSVGGRMVLNLFLEVQDENGNWVPLPDDEGDDHDTDGPDQMGDTESVTQDEEPELSDDPNSPNYRFRDTGYIANSRKEQAANMIKKFKDSGRRIMASELDWGAIETNPRAASELIVKSNLFGVTDWDGLRASGMEPGAGFLIDRVYASIATSPSESSPRARKDYALALQTIRDRFEASRTVPEVMAVLEDIGDELSGSQFNADETDRYAAEKAALDVAVSAHEKLRTERQKLVDAALAFQVQVSQLTYEQNKRTRRKWQPDPEIEKKLVPLRAQHDQALADLTDWDSVHPEYKEEWVSTKTADGWTSGRHSSVMLDEIREITMRMRAMKEAARMRNIAESPVTRGWITFGERFFKVLNYRSYKGSDTFAGHVTNAKNGKIKDWGWAEKERATVKSATKQEIGFQLKVAENFERKGGRPVAVASTLDLKNMIGFKEVQSGNWVLKDPNSAKFHVEQTAGAMLDMSDILGIDAKALGLGGRLGMAFGARGTGSAGWKTGAAAAHYEPVHRVINLTKMGGGGSLGHEWAHAMDDVLVELVTQAPQKARNYGSEDSSVLPPGVIRQAMDAVMGAMLKGTRHTTETLTIGPKDKDKAKYNIDRSYASKVAGLIKAAGGLDAAILAVDAHFGDVTTKSSVTNKKQWRTLAAAYWAPDGATEVKAKTGRQTSEFMAEAVIMDFGQIDKYWSRRREMFARAFQSYLEDKLQEQDRRNDYLSVFADNKFHVDPLFGIEWKPYPEGQERAAINAAFDGFFAAIRAEKVFEKALENKPLLDAIFGEQAG